MFFIHMQTIHLESLSEYGCGIVFTIMMTWSCSYFYFQDLLPCTIHGYIHASLVVSWSRINEYIIDSFFLLESNLKDILLVSGICDLSEAVQMHLTCTFSLNFYFSPI